MNEKIKEALERINSNIDIDQSNEIKDKIEEYIEEQEEYAENKKRYEEIKDSDDDTDLEEKADFTYEEEDGVHDWSFWTPHAYKGIEYLLKK